jgi:hypothetical protein
MIARDAAHDPLTPWRQCPPPGHAGLGAGFVEEDDGLSGDGGRGVAPRGADVRILLAGDDGLFLSGNPSRCKLRHIVAGLTTWPDSVSTHRAQCSARVASGWAAT